MVFRENKKIKILFGFEKKKVKSISMQLPFWTCFIDKLTNSFFFSLAIFLSLLIDTNRKRFKNNYIIIIFF
jgi:hypothetical protein